MPTYTHVIEFDEAELICRMAEAFFEQGRPNGMSASDVVSSMPDDMRDDWLRVSQVVSGYLHETIAAAKRVN